MMNLNVELLKSMSPHYYADVVLPWMESLPDDAEYYEIDGSIHSFPIKRLWIVLSKGVWLGTIADHCYTMVLKKREDFDG